MARVTTEDCLENSKIKNRFDLSLVASQRARNIISGSQLTLETNNDKPVVIALREIAEKVVDPEVLRQKLINSFLSSSHNSTLKESVVEDEDLATNEEMIVGNYYDEDITFAASVVEEGDNSDILNDEFTDETSK